MVRLSKRKKRFIISLSTTVAIGLVFCLVSHFNLLHGIHLKSHDFLFKTVDTNPAMDPDNKIVIVAIDDKSLDQLGRFSSWPRIHHAQLVNELAGAGARTIVFDVLFTEPTPDDNELAASIRNAGNVILPLVGTPDGQQSAVTGEVITLGSVLKPIKTLEESALAVAHANVIPDEDGVVRRLPLIIPNDGQYEPALALTAVTSYLRRPPITADSVENDYLSFAGRSVPLDNSSCMLINYTDNPVSSGGYSIVSYVDVLRNNISSDIFEDKIALIGVTAIGFGDVFWTPMGRVISGVELHASAIYNLLTGNFLKPAPEFTTNLSILLLAVICGLAVLRFRPVLATLSAVFLVIIYYLTAFYFFDRGIVLDMLYPTLSIAGVFVGINLYNVTSERLQKAEITRTFGRYVSPPVATKILNAVDEGSLKLGGEECMVTVLFADVRNFSGFSEKTKPQELVSILNRYLSVVIKAALQHDGMVNKFGGDSIMAVWNVPVNCPEHALLATGAAISAQQALSELQDRVKNLPKIEFGIGVNTGNAVAGNMGSADRLEYSVVGDAVNIASRLADAAPGGRIWIGADTFNLIKDSVSAVPLGALPLKGKSETIQAYEVVDTHNQQYDDREIEILRMHQEEV